jgi:hypothetical protein
MTALDRTRPSGHAPVCRRGVCRSQPRHPLNHRSEVPESAGLRPANYGEETLPTIGKVEGSRRRRQKPVVNNITRVILPPGLGVWDKAWPSPPMDQPQAQGIGRSSQL